MARSPNYPGIGLPDAIGRIRKVHTKAHTHKVDAETMAKAAGYNSLNGAALTMLSALKKYVLLEEVGKEFRVSQLAMTIIADPVDSPERRAAIQTAAFAPALFDDISKQYPGSVPSDEIVRSYLLKKGFIAGAVDGAIRAFRETMSLVTDEGMGYNARVDGNFEGNDLGAVDEKPETGAMAFKGTEPIVAIGAFKRDIFSLDEGQVILQWPEKISAESYEDFESWVQLQLRKIKRSVK